MSDWTGDAGRLLLAERDRALKRRGEIAYENNQRRIDGDLPSSETFDEDLARAAASDAQARCEDAAALRGAALVSIEHVRAYLGDVVNTSGWPKGGEA